MVFSYQDKIGVGKLKSNLVRLIWVEISLELVGLDITVYYTWNWEGRALKAKPTILFMNLIWLGNHYLSVSSIALCINRGILQNFPKINEACINFELYSNNLYQFRKSKRRNPPHQWNRGLCINIASTKFTYQLICRLLPQMSCESGE